MFRRILYQYLRISYLVSRLVKKLQSLKLLNANNHNFEQAVEACRNINTNLIIDLSIGSRILSSPTPQSLNPSNDNISGYSAVNIIIDGTVIKPSNIIRGHSILGIDGNVIATNDQNNKAYYLYRYTKSLYNVKKIDIWYNALLTPGEYLFNYTYPPVFLYRISGGGGNKKQIVQCKTPLDPNDYFDFSHIDGNLGIYYCNLKGLYLWKNNPNYPNTAQPYSTSDNELEFSNYPLIGRIRIKSLSDDLYFCGVYHICFLFNKEINNY